MRASFPEGALTFTFGEIWKVIKYDEHPDYLNGVQALGKTKAVDFVALYAGQELHFLEVKDFRGHDAEYEKRVSNGGLVDEIALKVRDTIAGIVGGYRNSLDSDSWKPYAETLTNRNKGIRVVLWLEQDLYSGPRRGAHALELTKKLKKRLYWLTSDVIVESRRTSGHGLPDLTVQDRFSASQA